KETRSAIERATQKARRILETDFAEQLEGTFEVLLSGVAAPHGGGHLTPRQHAVRERIVASVEHRRAAGEKPAEAVASYLRDAAFTALNRFAALQMIEARGLAQECVRKGEQSSGYREFIGLAPGVALLPGGDGYRLYLECLFDELSTEVKVLFDRRDPAVALWPRRAAFEELLGVLNAPELAAVWGEDETIGWVYQYFNSGDERRAMRDASQAPRNSRELAVRNQFFTPRYVVRFLTENTLARIWIEMMGGADGASRVADRCDFLVRDAESRGPRAKKDPRDLKLLDPACGSGHFLLYSFDLFLSIYEEAWADPTAAASATTGRTLRDDYPDLADLRRAVPALILEQNLHGVDIDARCAQIAALALWLRAQRAWKDAGLSAGERPRITKTNIVVAEPMPGDAALIKEFAATLNPPLLGTLFKRMVAEMRLAGELGTLLRIERTLASAIGEARQEYDRQRRVNPLGLDVDALPGEKDFSLIDDGTFFDRAEELLLSALRRFAESAAGGEGVRKRLFAGDAAQGIALVDIVRTKYDVVLMNPPFGEACVGGAEHLKLHFPAGASDLGAAFIQGGLASLGSDGMLGAIANRTLLAVQGFAAWRLQLLRENHLECLADLGHGVLDAMVETALFVWRRGDEPSSPGRHTGFLGLLDASDKHRGLLEGLRLAGGRLRWAYTSAFSTVPGAPLAYWVPQNLLERFTTHATFLATGGEVSQGTATADDFRFYRLRWEVPADRIHTEPHLSDREFRDHDWSPVAKGGEYGLWWDDIHLVQLWRNDGWEVRNFIDGTGKQRSFPKNLHKHFLRGGTFPYRTTSAFAMRLLPPGICFSVGGWAVFPPPDTKIEESLAIFNSRIARYFMEVLLGQGDSSASGTAARNHVSAAVGGIPWPRKALSPSVPSHVGTLIDLMAASSMDETALFFSPSRLLPAGSVSFESLLAGWWAETCSTWRAVAELSRGLELELLDAFQLDAEDIEAINDGEGRPLHEFADRTLSSADVAGLFSLGVEELTARAKATCGARRYLVKKAYFVERRVDLACHILEAGPESVIRAAKLAGPKACGEAVSFAETLLCVLFGVAVGRFVWQENSSPRGPAAVTALPKRGIEEGTDPLALWVDDPGHPLDIGGMVHDTAHHRWGKSGQEILDQAVWASGSGARTARDWYRSAFFQTHVSRYSKSRRKAPIYWQLATPSASYSVWLYAHRLTPDTFFHVLHDVVAPKLGLEERKLLSLTQESGPNPTASQRKEIAAQQTFVDELRAFRDEVSHVAPLWKPDLDDGVVLTMAPLWRLVPQHRAWQKELKAAWDSLSAGEYDWAHVAMHLWPERVVPKCATDRSLAIAHGLEEVFWEEMAKGKWAARKKPETPVATLVAERTSPAVKAALKDLLEAPVPGGAARSSGRGKRRGG
ncbi:MAG TPA: BREX-1 system adenine-specific DNA-methyltransferase PglX, partial [Thermoanaerobaculia bacterium]|nr:BREX-1 system adenine-specific DNA-methyltransferase PglX [Thermoanaerobaculia bacterium]